MEQFNTIHIFGYGETQVIAENSNKKVLTPELTTTQAVIDDVYSHKEQDSDASANIHAVNIFHGMFADYQPREGKGFRVQWAALDLAKIDALLVEFNVVANTTTTSTTTETTTTQP